MSRTLLQNWKQLEQIPLVIKTLYALISPFHNCIQLGLRSVSSIPCTLSRKRSENESRTSQVLWKLAIKHPKLSNMPCKRQQRINIMQINTRQWYHDFNLFFLFFFCFTKVACFSLFFEWCVRVDSRIYWPADQSQNWKIAQFFYSAQQVT